jgi:hypothetical protein
MPNTVHTAKDVVKATRLRTRARYRSAFEGETDVAAPADAGRLMLLV